MSIQLTKKESAPQGKYFSIYAYTQGVKKRCRKPSREQIELGLIPFAEKLDPVELAEIEAIAIAKIKETMKTYAPQASLNFSVIKINKEDGWFSMEVKLFDERNFKHTVNLGAGVY